MRGACQFCGDETGERFGEMWFCPDCAPDDSGDESPASAPGDAADEPPGDDTRDAPAAALDALHDAVAFFQDALDKPMGMGDGRTAREYLREERGWADETIDAAGLGWAPADDARLLDHLMREGHDRPAILGSGLFYEDGLRPHFRGRIVFPYFDRDGRPVYAIARDADHPDDHLSGQKYIKAVKTKPYSHVDEPIYGLGSLDGDGPVLITEGVADAITAHASGYRCISPVTVQFKDKHLPELRDELVDVDDPVFVVQDAEAPSSSVEDDGDGWAALHLDDHPAGIKGGVKTAGYLAREGVDAEVATLPRPGLDKVDLDDYLLGWGDLAPVLASAKPARQHDAYDPALLPNVEGDDEAEHGESQGVASRSTDRDDDGSDLDGSALFDLDFTDVAPVSDGYRGKNPLGHHGDSEHYFVASSTGGYDHKHKASYNALTYLLVDAGERRPDDPDGALSDDEMLTAWVHANREGALPDDDPIPLRALVAAAVEAGVVDEDDLVERESDGGDTYTSLPAPAWEPALAYIRETYDVDPGRTASAAYDGDRTPTVETCAPPAVDRVDVDDITDRWRAIRDRTDGLGTSPTIFADEAGSGKTTNTGIGLAERDEPHAILFDKHEKAREYVCDDATPDDYFHLKGGGQPRADVCLDAHHAGEHCDDHGDTANCPRMCPMYDLDADDPVRVEYHRLVDEVGPVRAHQLLDLPEHDDDGACPWLDQFGPLARADRVAGVHEYQTLKSVRDPSNGPTRQVVVDETPSVDGRDRHLDVETLVRLSNALTPRRTISSPEDDPTDHNHLHARAELAAFARRIVDALTDADAPDDLADVEPPEFAPTTVTVEVEPDDLPADIAPEDVQTDTRKRDVGMHGEGYETVRRHVAEVDLLAETLAHAKQAYEGAVLSRIRSDDKDWSGEPLATDALLAAAAAAGVDSHACRQAAAVPPELSACPRCRDDLEAHDGRLVCASCAWDEADDHLVGRDGAAARCDAELHADGDGTGLHYRRLPHPSDLPDAPVVLDATATPDKVAALYGCTDDEITVHGDDTLAVDRLRVTQILDGQYHSSTISSTDTVRERVERSVRKLADVHGELLVVGKLSILDTLDLPTSRDGVDVLHYHAARGLNRAAYDAVVAIGAPHPNVDDLRRDAALLTQDRDDLRVGGVEHSTRRDCEQPPVYRKLDHVDADGDGRAVATKHYTGLTGALFREGREKELEQVVHRIRPLLADDTQHAYLLTNVPTDLRVDDVCSFAELADPLATLLPVPEGALDLLDAVRDAAAGEADVDGIRADRLVETVGGERDGDGDVVFNVDALHRLGRASGLDVCERTVRRWVDDLVGLGLLDAGEYEPRAGVPYTADPDTLTRALYVITSNAGVEVAARRRFRAILAEAGGTLSWLDRARDVLGLRGGGDEVDPPPDTDPAPG